MLIPTQNWSSRGLQVALWERRELWQSQTKRSDPGRWPGERSADSQQGRARGVPGSCRDRSEKPARKRKHFNSAGGVLIVPKVVAPCLFPDGTLGSTPACQRCFWFRHVPLTPRDQMASGRRLLSEAKPVARPKAGCPTTRTLLRRSRQPRRSSRRLGTALQ